MRHICAVKSPAFETTSLFIIGHPNWLYLHAGIIDAGSQTKLYKTCSCCGRDTWHLESKQNLQAHKYLILIESPVQTTGLLKTKVACLWIYIKLGPCKLSLQASVDHHGYTMNCSHYIVSINCCGKTFHCNDNEITECNITNTYKPSIAYMLLYKLIMEC